jgi:hypothetical protein
MKPFKMRYYYLAPLLVLAMIACAKRDNDFAKKAAAGRDAQQKTANETNQTAPVNVGNGSASNAAGDAIKDADKDKNKKQDASYNGDLETKKSCENKVSMALDEKEEDVVYKDIVTNEDGTYTLQSTELFIDQAQDTAKPLQVNALGVPFNLPEGQDDGAGKNLNVVCQTLDLTDRSKEKINGDMTLPYDISTKDGSIKHLRQDKLALSKSEKIATSRIYPNSDKEYTFKKLISTESETMKIALVRMKDSKDFTLKIQMKSKSDLGVVTKTLKGTYSLKK